MNTSAIPSRIALAAGGTGGHVMPAIALAEALRAKRPDTDIRIFCGQKHQEIQWYEQAGESPCLLPAAPLGRGVLAKAKGLIGAARSYALAKRLLRSWKTECVVGLGGYVSGPAALAALRLGIRCVIHEQNAIAGKTNRWLARWADAVATTYPDAFSGARPPRRLEMTGNPLRRAALSGPSREQALARFQLDSNRLVLLVSGGSQGASGINEAMLGLLNAMDGETAARLQFLWAAGTRPYEQLSQKAAELPPAARARILPFIEDMGAAYAAADAVLCRAGSASLAEAAAWGLPMIAVPYPWAADDHQRLNARYFAQQGAAVLVEEKDFSVQTAMSAIRRALLDSTSAEAMKAASKRLARPDAAERLARLVLEGI